jgi:hypothetical protein
MVTRVALLVGACVVILGGVWMLSRSPKGAAEASVPRQEAAPKPKEIATEPAQAPDAKRPSVEPAKDAENPKVAAVEPAKPKDEPKRPEGDKPPKDAKPAHLIEVDLSKLPPDLVKELQGAIVEKRRPDAKPQPAEPAPKR